MLRPDDDDTPSMLRPGDEWWHSVDARTWWIGTRTSSKFIEMIMLVIMLVMMLMTPVKVSTFVFIIRYYDDIVSTIMIICQHQDSKDSCSLNRVCGWDSRHWNICWSRGTTRGCFEVIQIDDDILPTAATLFYEVENSDTSSTEVENRYTFPTKLNDPLNKTHGRL